MRFLAVLLIILALAAFALLVGNIGCRRHIDRSTVRNLDVKRYLGHWYEIARFDNFFEEGMDHVEAEYELLTSGDIRVINSGHDTLTGDLRVREGKAHTTRRPGRLRVSFFWIFYSDYNVMEIADDYSWALVGSRSPKYLWILSRTPALPQVTIDTITAKARLRGYDTDGLLFLDQK